MLHFIKRFWVAIALMLAGEQAVFGFALLGPYEAYQIPAIGYHLSGSASAFGNNGGRADLGAPKNIGEGYRINLPTVYYAYDFAFTNYFGNVGIANVDAAFAMYNNLTNATALNPNDYPYNSTRVNYRAQALQLYDLKSAAMAMLIEQLGLAQPDRWTWCLRDRISLGTCPAFAYFIIQRNFDPITDTYSQYVNNVLYDFQVIEFCAAPSNPFAPLLADALEIAVDPTQQADEGSAVAADGEFSNYGSFFQTFTRDDIGGLRYLYSSNNIYPELAENASVQIVTNTSQPVLLVTSNLALFYQQALTNSDAALIALYPGLVILTNLTFNSFSNIVTTNITPIVTVPPFAPAGTLQLTLLTNLVTNVQTVFHHTFANLQIVHSYSQTTVGQQVVSLQPVPFAPAGTVKLVTNVTFSSMNFTNGDFYILPTNLCGPYHIISTQFVNVVATTNFLPIITNLPPGFTNTASTTNFASFATINFFTNYYLVAQEVDCVTNTASLRGGMEKFNFVRREYDPILNQLVTPITNVYHLTAISNGVPVVQTFKRVVTQPDIVVTGEDLNFFVVSRTQPSYNSALVATNHGGPGTIDATRIRLSFNTVGPIRFGVGPTFTLSGGVVGIGQTNTTLEFQWGSFDGTTNDPVIYPHGTSIDERETGLYIQITTANLPDASVRANNSSNPYHVTLHASGPGLALPVTWSLAPNSGGLPPGLTLSSGGVISGSPTTPGVYDFTVQITDGNGKIAQREFSIVVNP